MGEVKEKLILLGGGGHCHSVYDSVRALGEYKDIGIVDHQSITDCGAPVLGEDSDLPALFEAGWTDAFITVGSIGNASVRRRLYVLLREIGFTLPKIIDPTAIIAEDVEIGEGVYIGKGAIVNARARVGCCAIINTGAVVEHDCVVEDFVHVSTGALLCGGVRVKADAHIGAGCVVRQGISIGEAALIGIGSVVVKDIAGGITAYGNPCRERKI